MTFYWPDFALDLRKASLCCRLWPELLDNAALKNFQVQNSPEAKHRYHSQHYKNGTVCDLTREPREASVHVSQWLNVTPFYHVVEDS